MGWSRTPHHKWSAKVPVRALRPQLPQPDSPGSPPQQHPLFWELHGAHTCLCPRSYTVHVPVPGLLRGHSCLLLLQLPSWISQTTGTSGHHGKQLFPARLSHSGALIKEVTAPSTVVTFGSWLVFQHGTAPSFVCSHRKAKDPCGLCRREASGRLRLYVHPKGRLASLPGGSGFAATCCLGILQHRRSGHAVGPTPHQRALRGSRACWRALVLPLFRAEAGRQVNPVRGGAQPGDRLGTSSARSTPAFGASIAPGVPPATQLLLVAGLTCGRRGGGRWVHGSQGSPPAAWGKARLVLGGRRGAPEQRMELGYIFFPHPRSCPGRTLGLGTKQGLITEGRSVASGPWRVINGEKRVGYSEGNQSGSDREPARQPSPGWASRGAP